MEEPKLVEVDGVEEWEVEKILKKEKDLENMKEAIVEFKERISVKVRRQEKLDLAEEQGYRRGELPEKYIAKMLYK